MFDLRRVDGQFALDHLSGDVLHEVDQGLFNLGVLFGNGLEQVRHQLLQRRNLGGQGHFGFLADLERGAVETFLLTHRETFVVGFLANAFEFFEGQWLDFLQRHFLHFRRLGFRLRFRLGLRRVETGQRPGIEATDIPGPDQVSGCIIILDHGVRSFPRRPCRRERFPRLRPYGGRW
ncbi:hypothetical protein D9M71_574190 [compost metagenome]